MRVSRIIVVIPCVSFTSDDLFSFVDVLKKKEKKLFRAEKMLYINLLRCFFSLTGNVTFAVSCTFFSINLNR